MSLRTRIGFGALLANGCLLAAGLAIGSHITVVFAVIGAITGSIWAAMTIRDSRKKNPQ